MRIKGADGHEYDVTGQGQGAFNTAGGIAGILALLGVDLGGLLGRNWNPGMSPDALVAALNGQRNVANAGTIEMVLSLITMLLAQGGCGGYGGFGRGHCGGCSENTPASRYDIAQSEKMTALESENSLLKSNIYTDSKIADVYERLNIKINNVVEKQNEINMQQAVYNGTNNATIACMKGQIAELQGLSELVIPRSRVCNTRQCECNCDQ